MRGGRREGFRRTGSHDRHRLVIVGQRPEGKTLASMLRLAKEKGLARVASLLERRMLEHDAALLERGLRAVEANPALAGVLIQLGAHNGTLHCRSWANQGQEDALISSLGAIGCPAVDLEIHSTDPSRAV